MSTGTRTAPETPTEAPVFDAILCGVDATPASEVAVRQAAALAGPGGALELVACVGTPRAQTAQLLLTRPAAEHALRRLARVAEDAGVAAVGRIVEPGRERHPLLRAAEGHDLLVVGTHGGGRIPGVLAASTTTAAAHGAPCPVLVARDGGPFPGTVLVADDGTHDSGRAARLAGAIANGHGGHVLVAAPSGLPEPRRRRLVADMIALEEATGREPVAIDVDGPPARVLPVLATRLEAGLLVLGSRRLRGLAAVGSVSERVAHAASCSVLVVRD